MRGRFISRREIEWSAAVLADRAVNEALYREAHSGPGMGTVLEQIEDLNRAGKSAFDGDAATRGKFNKDILLRARKERAKKKGEDAPKGGGAAPAA
jgi:hypothetical protein